MHNAKLYVQVNNKYSYQNTIYSYCYLPNYQRCAIQWTNPMNRFSNKNLKPRQSLIMINSELIVTMIDDIDSICKTIRLFYY